MHHFSRNFHVNRVKTNIKLTTKQPKIKAIQNTTKIFMKFIKSYEYNSILRKLTNFNKKILTIKTH